MKPLPRIKSCWSAWYIDAHKKVKDLPYPHRHQHHFKIAWLLYGCLLCTHRKQRREERLSQNPSLQTDCSQESDNSATPVNLNADRRHCPLDDPITTDTNDDPADDWPENWEKEWIADDDEVDCIDDDVSPATLYKDGHVNHSFSSQADILKLAPSSSSTPLECCSVQTSGGGDVAVDLGRRLDMSPRGGASGLHSCPKFSFSPKEDCEFSFTPTQTEHEFSFSPKGGDCHFSFTSMPKRKGSGPTSAPPVLDLLGSSLDDLPGAMDPDDDPHGDKSLSSNPGMPLLGNNSSSEDNILISSLLPNGVLILSPNGDVYARDSATGKNVLVRPKTFANFKNFTTNLPQSMKTLPLKDNRVKSNLLSRSRTLDGLNDGAINNDIEPSGATPSATTSSASTSAVPKANLEHLSKEQLYFMWKMSEKDLNKRLKRALREKAELEEKLAKFEPDTDTWCTRSYLMVGFLCPSTIGVDGTRTNTWPIV